MEILYGDNWCTIPEPRKHLASIAIIKSICRARPKGYRFMPKYRAGYWDGYVTVMKGVSSFPTGLLNIVVDALMEKRIKVTVKYPTGNEIISKLAKEDDLEGIKLRDYQLDAINKLVLAGRGIAKMATGSGKTEVIAGIIHTLDYPKTVVLLHRKELLYQTQARFEARLCPEKSGDIGVIGDSNWCPGNITVAMIQTLYNHKSEAMEIFKDVQLVITDECHNASSDTYMNIISDLPGKYRYGFSGTPLKYEDLPDMKLIANTGPVLVDIGNSQLIEEGYSAEPTIYIKKISVKDTKELWKLNYQEAYIKFIVENEARNAHIIEVAIREKSRGPVLILVNRIEHGNILSSMCKELVFVSGSESTEFRLNVLENMKGGYGIYCATPIYDEGIDVPLVTTIILAGGGNSYVRLLQRIGRGLRKKEIDNTLHVYDYIDGINKHLMSHSKDRMVVYAKEGFEVVRS